MRSVLHDESTIPRARLSRGLSRRRDAIGPYSKLIDRGALGGAIDGRSREGRFLRAYERQLVEHLAAR
jgi:hypothetical protein